MTEQWVSGIAVAPSLYRRFRQAMQPSPWFAMGFALHQSAMGQPTRGSPGKDHHRQPTGLEHPGKAHCLSPQQYPRIDAGGLNAKRSIRPRTTP